MLDIKKKFVILQPEIWGFSSSGRALGSQSKGGRFESGILHKLNIVLMDSPGNHVGKS